MVTTPNFDLDTDTTLGGSNASDYTIASQKAIKSYVDNSTGATIDQTFDGTSANAQSGVAIAGELAKYPQKAQNENITGVYNFVGQKKITFSQSTSSDKVGFTCFNASNTEIGALEYRPSTIGNGALLNLNTQYNTTNYVGFRYWGTAVNIVAPKVSTAGNYYIPTHITNGSSTVTASNTGTVDISTLLPDVSNFVTNSSLATTLSSYATQTWVGQQGYITGITSSDVTNALGYTPYNSTNPDGYLSSSDFKTINNTSIVGSGNIDTTQIFVATYGTTTLSEITTAINNGKTIFVKNSNSDFCPLIRNNGTSCVFSQVYSVDMDYDNYIMYYVVDSNNDWNNYIFPILDQNLSNLSSNGQKVIDGQWVVSDTEVGASMNLNGSSDLEFTLQVPNDGYKYEALLTFGATSTSTSGQLCQVNVRSSISNNYIAVCRVIPRTAVAVYASGNIILPLSTDRKFYVNRSSTIYGTISVYLRAYRRIGSNT